MNKHLTLLAMLAVAIFTGNALGQSSSLLLEKPLPPNAAAARNGGQVNRLSPAVARVGLTAVGAPEPRLFAVQDLLTIIVRESTQADAAASLDTKKDMGLDGSLTALPNLDPSKLLQFQVAGSTLKDPPKVKLDFKRDFNGEGGYSRKDTITSRITARIIDVKPNGLLVLEARKFIQSDDETLNMVLSGTCRREDVTTDNTVLSTQLFDLRLATEHKGELRKSSRKGWLTKLFEGIFNF